MRTSLVPRVSAALLLVLLPACVTLSPSASYSNRDHGQPAAQLHILPQEGWRPYNFSEWLSVEEITCDAGGKATSQRFSLARWQGFTDDFPAYDASLPAGRVILYHELDNPQIKRIGRFVVNLEAGHKYRFQVDKKFINLFKGSSFTPTLIDLGTGSAIDVRNLPASVDAQALCPVNGVPLLTGTA